MATKDHKALPIMLNKTGRSDRLRPSEGGFTLLEMIAALAILAIVVSIALPRTGHGTSQTQLRAFAYRISAILANDRYSARHRGTMVSTSIDTSGHRLQSGTTGSWLLIPADINLSGGMEPTCSPAGLLPDIRFFPDGYTCGGKVRLETEQSHIDISINRLTGSVSLVD